MRNTTSSNQKERILVVDDNKEVTQAISLLLGRDFEIFSANNLHDARKLLNFQGYAVIILDFDLEDEMDGIDFSNEVNRYNSFSHIILLTGNLEYNTIKRALNEGKINHFLNKPIIVKDLREQISKAIDAYKEGIKVTNLLTNPEDMKKIQLFITDILKQDHRKEEGDKLQLHGVFIANDSIPIFSRLRNDLLEKSADKKIPDSEFGSLFSSFLSALVTLGSEAFINKEGQQLNGFKFKEYNFIFKFVKKFQITYLIRETEGMLSKHTEEEIDFLHNKINKYLLIKQPKKYISLKDQELEDLIDEYMLIQ